MSTCVRSVILQKANQENRTFSSDNTVESSQLHTKIPMNGLNPWPPLISVIKDTNTHQRKLSPLRLWHTHFEAVSFSLYSFLFCLHVFLFPLIPLEEPLVNKPLLLRLVCPLYFWGCFSSSQQQINRELERGAKRRNTSVLLASFFFVFCFMFWFHLLFSLFPISFSFRIMSCAALR